MVSALLDELMGRSLWIKNPELYGVTTTLSVTFRKPTPFGKKLKARAYMTFEGALGFTAKGELFDMEDNLLATATCKYLKMKPEVAFSGTVHADDEMVYDIPLDITEIDFPPRKD
jgi:acyl-coenzyme A thioesterase PaaI-like protein